MLHWETTLPLLGVVSWQPNISLEKGLRWRVGNGESIRVWADKWLPTSSTYTVISPRVFLQANTRVSKLIEASTTSWKTSIVDALFLSHEVETIKSIPLSSRLPANKLVWTKTSNGLFSVSSYYKLVVKASQHENWGEGL